jgi:hypothetical protein
VSSQHPQNTELTHDPLVDGRSEHHESSQRPRTRTPNHAQPTSGRKCYRNRNQRGNPRPNSRRTTQRLRPRTVCRRHRIRSIFTRAAIRGSYTIPRARCPMHIPPQQHVQANGTRTSGNRELDGTPPHANEKLHLPRQRQLAGSTGGYGYLNGKRQEDVHTIGEDMLGMYCGSIPGYCKGWSDGNFHCVDVVVAFDSTTCCPAALYVFPDILIP